MGGPSGDAIGGRIKEETKWVAESVDAVDRIKLRTASFIPVTTAVSIFGPIFNTGFCTGIIRNFFAMESIHVLLLAIFGFIGYYLFFVVKKPKVITSNRVMEQFLRSHVDTVNQSYWPSLLHYEGRLQSILGLTRRVTRPGKMPYERELFSLSDGGQLGLDFLQPESLGIKVDPQSKRLKVLLLPGLANSSQTSYVRTLALSIVTTGASLVVYNNRGLAGVPLKTAKTYCAAKYSDLREVVLHLKQKYEGEKIIVIGCSLGGMMLSQYLINHPEESKDTFSAAMLISVVWDAISGIQNIERPGMNSIVNSGMAESLKGLARKHQTALSGNCSWDFDFEKVMRSKTLRDFDTSFTAKQFGYSSVWDYYKDCTIVEKVDKFSFPVFALNAADDPMNLGSDLPTAGALSPNSNLVFIISNRGGHLGFLEGILPTKKSFHFSERLVMDWLRAMEHHGHQLTAH